MRDKAVHSIRRFLSAAPKPTKASKRKASDEAASDDDDDAKGEAQEDGEDDEMDMGDWDDASLGTGEKRLSELELDKLWKGLYYCPFSFPHLFSTLRQFQLKSPDPTCAHRLLDVGQAVGPAGAGRRARVARALRQALEALFWCSHPGRSLPLGPRLRQRVLALSLA